MTEVENLKMSAEHALQQLTERGITEMNSFTPSTELPDEMEVWTMGRTVYDKIEKIIRVETVDVLITMAWPEDRMARGVTLNFDIEFMAEGDIFVPKEESRFGIPYLIQTWNTFQVNFDALLGKRFTLHQNHYDSVILVMAEKIGVDLRDIEDMETCFELVDGLYSDICHYIPYRKRLVKRKTHNNNGGLGRYETRGSFLLFEGVTDPSGWNPERYREGVKQHYFWLKAKRSTNNIEV